MGALGEAAEEQLRELTGSVDDVGARLDALQRRLARVVAAGEGERRRARAQ